MNPKCNDAAAVCDGGAICSQPTGWIETTGLKPKSLGCDGRGVGLACNRPASTVQSLHALLLLLVVLLVVVVAGGGHDSRGLGAAAAAASAASLVGAVGAWSATTHVQSLLVCSHRHD